MCHGVESFALVLNEMFWNAWMDINEVVGGIYSPQPHP
jgi:hypothetical protein